MIHSVSVSAIGIFLLFVVGTIGLSFYLGRRAKSSAGFFAAHGQIPWFVNGVAFAGDYLSAASFLGICGMIAFYGYDGFLYSIGYLAGWIVALFVIAEPMKRLGRFTFADALDAKFDSPGIKLTAGISTLVVSLFYLIPQMVGAGVLVQPLLGLPHWAGVLLVGAVVIFIVITAGMVSTTWVQFMKGSLLVIFSLVLTVLVLQRGLTVVPNAADANETLRVLGPVAESQIATGPIDGRAVIAPSDGWEKHSFVRLADPDGGFTPFSREPLGDGTLMLREAQAVTKRQGATLIGGLPRGKGNGQRVLKPVGHVEKLPGGQSMTGPLGPLEFLQVLQDSRVLLWREATVLHETGSTTVYFQKSSPGSGVLRPGEHPVFAGIRGGDATSTEKLVRDRINFLSLMMALFCGTASLPHILIRYYTVKDGAAARKSTIVGIASIGAFYILTLYLGLGAMVSGSLDVTDSNMSAPLLARSISELLFAIVSAIAFTTVLGTVSGLILASSGAVAHDLLRGFLRLQINDAQQVHVAKIAAVVVGTLAIGLGILFQKMNVNYLVGWAFSVAASANLPALVMLLFWKGTTKQGVIASVLVGMISSLGWILLSSDTYKQVYGIDPQLAPAPFTQPGIVTIPLSFLTLFVVSKMTRIAELESSRTQSAEAQ